MIEIQKIFPTIKNEILDDKKAWKAWILENMKAPPKSELRFIDLNHFAKYNETSGVSVAIDGLHNVDPQNLYIVIYSMSPPGSFYTVLYQKQHMFLFCFFWH